MSPLNKGQRSTMRIVNVVVNYEQTKISLRVTLAKKKCTRVEVGASKGCFYASRVVFDRLLEIMQINGLLRTTF